LTERASPARPRQGLIGGVLVTLVAEGVALPAGLITAMVLTRGLGPGPYGRFVVVASTVAMIEWLLIAVLARPVVKFVAEAADWRPVAARSFRLYLLAGLAIGGLVWLFAGAMAAALNDPMLADDFRLFAPQIPLFAIGAACRNVLAGQARYREQAASSAVGWVGRVTFIVTFVTMGLGITGAILGSIAGTAVGSLTAHALVGRAVWGRAGFPTRQLLQLALPAFLSLLFARLLDQLGVWMLQGLGVDEVSVGYFGAAMNVMLITSVIAAAVTPVLLSTLSAARYQGEEAHVHEVSRGAVRFGLALLPFGAVVAGAAGELAQVLFGQEYGPAGPMMGLLMIGSLARAAAAVNGSVFIALNRAWTAALIAIPVPFVAVPVFLMVIPVYGALGTALVTMVLALAALALSVAVAWKVIGIVPPLATLVRSVVIGAVVYGVAAWWPTPGPLVIAKVAVLGLAVLAAFAISGELNRQEIAGLAQLARAGRVGGPVRR